ncbi:response regulator [Candidatus Riflebacteria bacterium]
MKINELNREQLVSKIEKLTELNSQLHGELELNKKQNAARAFELEKEIQEREKAEMEFRLAAERAENAIKLKDKFVSMVAHDLKSPLAVINGYLDLIKREPGITLSERQQKFIEKSKKNSERMINMIGELLNQSRLQADRIIPKFKFIDAAKVSDKAIDSIAFLAEQKGINIINNIPPGSRLYADFQLFAEVIKNLVSNAIKFCNEKDSIELYLQAGKESCIKVKDTGVGIPEKLLSRLFVASDKKSRDGTAGEKGTGFGLPICQEIMDSHQGRITVESNEGEGSIFTIEMPAIKPTVLIVDDQEIFHASLVKILEKQNLVIEQAFDGKEALEKIHEKAPHLIISDISMPEMDGFQLIEKVKGKANIAKIPMIMITSDENIETRERVFQLGAEDFITKPVNAVDLLPRLRKYLI